jgi:hypothetical protein
MAEKLSFFLEEWEKCDPDGFASRTTRKETLLETIARVRLADVRAAEQVLPLSDLKAKVRAQRLPPPSSSVSSHVGPLPRRVVGAGGGGGSARDRLLRQAPWRGGYGSAG